MKKLLFVFLIITTLIVAGCTSAGNKTKANIKLEATIFKNPSCGCCGVYAQYMEKESFSVEVKETTNIDSIKSEFKIPANLQSCHTAKIGNYFVEGHIPVEAIEKLLTEKPDIAGIAMPGMPSGSPGMPGTKNGPWTIYSVDHEGNYEEYMII